MNSFHNLKPRLTAEEIVTRADRRQSTQGQIKEQQFIDEALRKHSELEYARDRRRRLRTAIAFTVGIVGVTALLVWLILN